MSARVGDSDGAGDLRERVKTEILGVLAGAGAPAVQVSGPRVVLVVGVNGTGKTTTVGKLARRCRLDGQTPLICAADTFRAGRRSNRSRCGRNAQRWTSCARAMEPIPLRWSSMRSRQRGHGGGTSCSSIPRAVSIPAPI